MNYTQNYHLPQWVETDRILMDDFNDAYSAIDAALKTNADGLSAETAARESAVAAKGNCRMFLTTYTGTGAYGQSSPCSVTFPWKPEMVSVFAPNGNLMEILYGSESAIMRTSYMGAILSVTWTGNTVKWHGNHPDEQLNGSGLVFTVIALGAAA